MYFYPDNIMRLHAMAAHNQDLISRLMAKPEVAGIVVHGSFSEEPRHETDASSDLDLTVVIDCGYSEEIANSSDPRTPIPWLNFKSYQALNVPGKPLEVDMYYFDMVNDQRPWNVTTREGYSYSSSVVFDRNGRVKDWIAKNCELTPELRQSTMSQLMNKANKMLANLSEHTSIIDQRVVLTRVVKLLVEVIFYINWEYPPDTKWRVSGSQVLPWRPQEFVTFLGECNKTTSPTIMTQNVYKLLEIVESKLAEEGFEATEDSMSSPEIDQVTRIARLFTRLDKYSNHSVKKCIQRGLPWNAHDLVAEGVENAIDIIYTINGIPAPATNKYRKLDELSWKPRKWRQYFYQASSVSNYENADDAALRAEALRNLFLSIKKKIEEMNIFTTSSLYAEDFMGEDLFSKTSPYMKVFKGGMYQNRQQEKDTFAEIICEKVNLSQHGKNILFGMCSHYLLSNEEEFLALDPKSIHSTYLPVWKEVVKQLN